VSIIEIIKSITPLDDWERRDIAYAIDAFERYDGDILTRENEEAHVCSTCWVLNKARTKVLMAHHNIYNSYAYLGGHADGQSDIAECARHEVAEESGIKNFRQICDSAVMVDIRDVKDHTRRGKLVPAHRHINLLYVFEADEAEPLKIQHDENSAVAWLPLDTLSDYIGEDDKHMIPIYQRIIKKLMGKV